MSATTPTPTDRDAWGDFWAQNSGATAGGCLPDRWAVIEQAQQAIWHGFIADLPDGAAVLDLATGDGRVLRWMRDVRSDLKLTGIDLAPQLPEAPEGTETRGGIAMEELPFDDNAFAAVVSQFGFEYGDVQAVAKEIARVLAPGGTVGVMVHRGDGPILEHNLTRRAAIEWALNDKAVGTVVRTALTAPNGGPEAAVQVAAVFAMLGASNFGQESPAWEIPEAIRRAVVMGHTQGNDSVIEAIAAIEAQAENELGRIASLERACAMADARAAIEAAFAVHDLAPQATTPVKEPSGRVLADFLMFG